MEDCPSLKEDGFERVARKVVRKEEAVNPDSRSVRFSVNSQS